MKNLVFQGGPRIKKGIVKINNIESLEEHILDFNNCFSKIGVKVDKDDVKSECRYKFERDYILSIRKSFHGFLIGLIIRIVQ